MPNNYMLKFKGKYRLLPKLDTSTHDFPRNQDGTIDDDTEVYIACQYGNEISFYGLDKSRRGILIGYIPSLGRGRNIKKAMDKEGIEYFNYDESDEEVMFHFKTKDIEPVAELMKAKTSGASISPFSSRNLPKADVKIPEEEINRYKNITSKVNKNDMLIIKNINQSFLDEVLAKKLREKGTRKPFDYATDMKKMKLSRQIKEYIWIKGLFDEYLEFLNDKIDVYYG